jgi:hypothetical protein
LARGTPFLNLISGGIAALNHRKINTLPKPHPEVDKINIPAQAKGMVIMLVINKNPSLALQACELQIYIISHAPFYLPKT